MRVPGVGDADAHGCVRLMGTVSIMYPYNRAVRHKPCVSISVTVDFPVPSHPSARCDDDEVGVGILRLGARGYATILRCWKDSLNLWVSRFFP
ncbi:MAG: hypothetical protein P8182_13735, partial [Deltaproteobacteria bacterium]